MSFLHRAKCICSNHFLYKQEIEKLRILFQKISYSNWFINKIITKFEDHNFNNTNAFMGSWQYRNTEEDFLCTFCLPRTGKPFHTFLKNPEFY